MVSTDNFTEYSWEALRNARQYTNGDSPGDAAQYATNNLISVLGYNPYSSGTPVGTDGKLVSTDKKWDNDWEKGLINDNAERQEYSFNVTGGSENTKYFMAANYLSQEGSIQTSNFERITARMTIDSKLTDWLTTGINMFYSTSKQNYPDQSGNSFQSAQQWLYSVSSFYPLYKRDNNGDLVYDSLGNRIYDYGDQGGQPVNGTRPVFGGENGVGALYNYDVENKRDLISVNGYALVTITDDLNFRSQLSYEKYIFDNYNYVSNEFGYAANVGGRVDQSRDITTTITLLTL